MQVNIDNEGKKIKQARKTILDRMDLTGIQDWDSEDQKEAGILFREYTCIFSQHYLDLGKMSLVKYHIKLTDEAPSQQHYRRIPLSMYKAVKKHMKEMLDIGASFPSKSPWACPVVLVCKKDGKSHFGIDL